MIKDNAVIPFPTIKGNNTVLDKDFFRRTDPYNKLLNYPLTTITTNYFSWIIWPFEILIYCVGLLLLINRAVEEDLINIDLGEEIYGDYIESFYDLNYFNVEILPTILEDDVDQELYDIIKEPKDTNQDWWSYISSWFDGSRIDESKIVESTSDTDWVNYDDMFFNLPTNIPLPPMTPTEVELPSPTYSEYPSDYSNSELMELFEGSSPGWLRKDPEVELTRRNMVEVFVDDQSKIDPEHLTKSQPDLGVTEEKLKISYERTNNLKQEVKELENSLSKVVENLNLESAKADIELVKLIADLETQVNQLHDSNQIKADQLKELESRNIPHENKMKDHIDEAENVANLLNIEITKGNRELDPQSVGSTNGVDLKEKLQEVRDEGEKLVKIIKEKEEIIKSLVNSNGERNYVDLKLINTLNEEIKQVRSHNLQLRDTVNDLTDQTSHIAEAYKDIDHARQEQYNEQLAIKESLQNTVVTLNKDNVNLIKANQNLMTDADDLREEYHKVLDQLYDEKMGTDIGFLF